MRRRPAEVAVFQTPARHDGRSGLSGLESGRSWVGWLAVYFGVVADDIEIVKTSATGFAERQMDTPAPL